MVESKDTPDGPWIHDGLNLSVPDVTTAEEWAAWRAHELRTRGYPLPSWDFWADRRPDVVKRWLVEQQRLRTVGSFGTPLTWVHLYAILGFEAGLLYTIDIAERAGHCLDEVLDALSVAFLHSPSMGTHYLVPALEERLDRYVDPPTPFTWPAGWAYDPDQLRSGMDFSHPDASAQDVVALTQWYERVCGEVPRSVRFLGELRPDALKAFRHRMEHALRVMPNQMLPLMMLHYATVRGHEEAIREHVLLARGLGATRTQTVDAIVGTMHYAGTAGMAIADRAAGDILRSWER
jgi:hypothetical protein